MNDYIPESTFVHLHNHTDFSLLDGAAPIAKYMERAKSLGMGSLAITDHGNMFGAVRFYNAARDAGIKPIIGCEFYCNP
ncbi:MAG: PHP domain-containing protein, partial [Sphaerochaeta sp.]|nr:PHP domain-containing protein [Sphaerochaeta sp.]